MSFHSILLYCPNPTGQNVTISIIGGAINANAELLTAPTREIMDSSRGMQAAKTTVKEAFAFVRLLSFVLRNTYM